MLVSDFEVGQRIRIGNTEGEIVRVEPHPFEGLAFLEWECDSGCVVEDSGNRHRVYERAMRRWLENDHMEVLE